MQQTFFLSFSVLPTNTRTMNHTRFAGFWLVLCVLLITLAHVHGKLSVVTIVAMSGISKKVFRLPNVLLSYCIPLQCYYLLGKGGYVFSSVGMFVCLFCLLGTLLKKLSTDCDKILWRGPGW